MHGKGIRTEAAHARAARASEGHGRALLPCAFLLALVALLLLPTRAYADGANYRTVLYSGDYGGGKQYIVGADNKYDAAAYICGQTSAQVAAYDLTVRYKLSATENDFAALADSLEKDWPGWNEDTLAQSLAETFTRDVNGLSLWDVMTQSASVSAGGGVIFNQGALSLFQVKYWQDSVDCDIYAVDTTSDAVSRARDDLQEILNGGGSSGGGTLDGNTITLQCYDSGVTLTSSPTASAVLYGSQTIQVNEVNYRGVVTSRNAPDIVVDVGETNAQIISQKMQEGWKLYTYVTVSSGTAYITLVLTDIAPTVVETNRAWGVQKSWQWTGLPSANCFTLDNASITNQYTLVNDSANGCYKLSGNRTLRQTSFATQNGTWDLCNYNGWNNYYSDSANGGGNDPDPPSGPGNWPDPPSNPNPEPPTVPDPPQNPEPDPPSTPVAPTPPPLEPPTNVTIPTNTTPQDYTPWLRAILEQLQTLTDELASHCVHLQEEMQQSVNDLTDALIYRFNSLESQIWDLFNGLEDYLHDLAAWLAEQLDFNVNVDPYDDKSVLYWLRKIYGRLGNQPKAPTTVIDPDPTEPFDFWAWLMGLIANTVGGIIGDLVGDVAGLLDLFKDKFPFSIPWDIAALLGLLDGTRATPVFDVKLAAVPGWWQETNFRIDLTPFDSVAAACRTMVNIIWVMALVMKTNWMLETMDNATSFGERFARKVARTS